MSLTTFKQKLASGQKILIDGGMGTEILRRGLQTELPLWSADVLLNHPEVVQQIHEDHIKAGAEVIVTNTFATTRRMFAKKGIEQKARGATILACRLASQARDTVESAQNVVVAGSVAPMEDCYSPKLTPPREDLEKEHLELAQDLRDGGVDFLLLETMITLRETLAACRAAQSVQLPMAVSFCCDEKGQLLGGEPLAEVLKAVQPFHPLFIGVNCVSTKIATETVRLLRGLTELPVAVYAQGDGEPDDDTGWVFREDQEHSPYLDAAKNWLDDGAQLIGGCCGTTPQDIAALHKLLQSDAR